MFFAAANNRAIAIFIHGGWWQHDRSLTPSHMARGLNAHGIAVAVTSYDSARPSDRRDIVEQIRRACAVPWPAWQRLSSFGHSAGGHLAAAMAATGWSAGRPPSCGDMRSPARSTSIRSSALDEPGLETRRRRGARALSPVSLVTPDGVFDAVVGELEFERIQARRAACSPRPGAHATRRQPAPITLPSSIRFPDPASAMVARISLVLR